MTYLVYAVPPDKCVGYWPYVKDHLDRAITRTNGRWQKEYVLAGLVLGKQTLWVIQHNSDKIVGALTTQIIQYPERRMVMIHFLGGKGIEEWYQDMSDTIAQYGKDNGCQGLECIARSGFWKWFEGDDFKRTAVFYEKNFDREVQPAPINSRAIPK